MPRSGRFLSYFVIILFENIFSGAQARNSPKPALTFLPPPPPIATQSPQLHVLHRSPHTITPNLYTSPLSPPNPTAPPPHFQHQHPNPQPPTSLPTPPPQPPSPLYPLPVPLSSPQDFYQLSKHRLFFA
ncbi:hypothetical protein Pmani_014313 [Petrolisthes manimaculis]|uniref:Uncharacterized protein n=1 Tax=Petrolisthes manimaculis TaxID=1843537 RepID=A0AAE1PVY1_9EUCA|nr:hypothetical protein Pmani_014313 [Petrolisthes manimaculis]